MQTVDLLITHASQLVTCANENHPKRGAAMRDVGIIRDGAVAVKNGKIIAVGTSEELIASYQSDTVIDASGKIVTPGLVDCHTHTIFAGNRLDEFEMRIAGTSYMDIMNAGGGIMRTVRATRDASLEELIASGRKRLDMMLSLGMTTIEIKTGYGLSTEAEAKMLEAILQLSQEHPMTIVPTYLGAHASPPEYHSTKEYVEAVVDDLEAIHAQYQASSISGELPLFVDIFVEDKVFTVDEMQRVFEAAQKLGFERKAHVDEFVNLGAVPVAIKMGAISLDHLDATPEHELDILAQSDTVGVMLPAVNFNLGSSHYGNARYLIDAGGILALSTDYNPGSAPTMSLPMVMAIACRFQKLLPAEAFNACTINAAAALKLEDKVGSIEVGKQSDFCIFDTDDYRSLCYEFGHHQAAQVIIRGETIWNAS